MRKLNLWGGDFSVPIENVLINRTSSMHLPCILCFCELTRACTRAKFPHNPQECWHVITLANPAWVHRPSSCFLLLTALFSVLVSSFHCSVLSTSLDWFFLFSSGTFLPSFFSGLAGNLARKLFVWVSRQNRQGNLLTGTYPHPQKWMPDIVSQNSIIQIWFEKMSNFK